MICCNVFSHANDGESERDGAAPREEGVAAAAAAVPPGRVLVGPGHRMAPSSARKSF